MSREMCNFPKNIAQIQTLFCALKLKAGREKTLTNGKKIEPTWSYFNII